MSSRDDFAMDDRVDSVVVGICISQVGTYGYLLLGELYLLEKYSRISTFEQVNVVAYQIHPKQFVPEKMFCIENVCVIPITEEIAMEIKKDNPPIYCAAHRFEILFTKGQFQAQLTRAADLVKAGVE